MKWIRNHVELLAYIFLILFMLLLAFVSITAAKKSRKAEKAHQKSTYKLIQVENEPESDYMERIYYYDSLDSFLP